MSTMNDFSLPPSDLGKIGQDLARPECVLCTAAGDIFVSHFQGGVTRIRPTGGQQHYLGPGNPTVATNGFAITRGGDFLCANLLEPGGVWRVSQDGRQTPFLLEVEGYVIPSVNFVYLDEQERAWIAVSTRRVPRTLGYRPDVDDGFIVLVDGRGARIAADGLGYTNEAKVDPSGRWLYVNETFARRTSRFPLKADGALGARETVAEYGHGTFPDGLEFDCEGGVWLTSVISNRVIRVAPDGSQQVIMADYDSARLDEIERIFQAGQLERNHMDGLQTRFLKNISSIAFGGPDLKTAYLGNLHDGCVYTFASPVAGAAPPHWKFAV
ncbi:MAG: SMP-30/gluconolactonase/LRE family protein [Gammaproteobacteria bacterium]